VRKEAAQIQIWPCQYAMEHFLLLVLDGKWQEEEIFEIHRRTLDGLKKSEQMGQSRWKNDIESVNISLTSTNLQ